LVNSIIASSQIFTFYRTLNVFFDLSISIYGRIFMTYVPNCITVYFFFLGNLIEIIINIERAVYFSEGFKRLKKMSPNLIGFCVFILSLLIYTPNFLSAKMVPEDKIFILYSIVMPSDFALSKIGKLILIICYILEGPVIFILLIASNLLALFSYKKFNQRKELIDRANNIEMMSEGEIKKKKKIEKTDRKLLILTSYLTLFSILTAILVQSTARYFYFIETSLSPQTFGWMIFTSCFSIALKQSSAIIVYYSYKKFRKEFRFFLKKVFTASNRHINQQ
jgi:hypothetical protein